MCIMHPKYKSTPATNSCNRGGFIRKGVLTLPAPFFTQLQINLWYKNFMYVCSSREMVPSLRHYKIFCVNGNTGFRNESRIFYFIHLQNEEAYERKESSSA